MHWIKKLRQQRGWSQAELARRAVLNSNTVCMIESGRWVPYPKQLSKLSNALGVSEADAHRLLEPVGLAEDDQPPRAAR